MHCSWSKYLAAGRGGAGREIGDDPTLVLTQMKWYVISIGRQGVVPRERPYLNPDLRGRILEKSIFMKRHLLQMR